MRTFGVLGILIPSEARPLSPYGVARLVSIVRALNKINAPSKLARISLQRVACIGPIVRALNECELSTAFGEAAGVASNARIDRAPPIYDAPSKLACALHS